MSKNAMTRDVDTPRLGAIPEQWPTTWPIDSSQKVLYAGGMVALNGDGELVEATDAAAGPTGLIVMGTAPLMIDNTDDGEYSAVDCGVHKFAPVGSNDPTVPLEPVYVYDATHVVVEAGTTYGIPAGLYLGTDPVDGGIWVDQRPAALRLARMGEVPMPS
jgi:hypothetical protein